ncbi:ComC/BlpC family leader-containing pheromone/bacteriocin [Streptococcus lutetiensis]|uniref:ComC/BlpC family leader-containing pheromone/bacteriocin n=1 Tax=Streptococcus lutetiensis TaxID=150055 RepID=UPI0019645418|nr:ComC/BlpC family leader-containing pheromone/bacteriocin [Streptococcus lutetiensis]
MNTKTIEQFAPMTAEDLARVEGGNQVFAGGGGKFTHDQPWWTKVDWCSIASGVNGGMIVC